MEKFNNFMALTEGNFGKFLKDSGHGDLIKQWKDWKNDPKLTTYGEPNGWSDKPSRPIDELRQVLHKAVDATKLENGKGIKDLDFKIINQEDVEDGTKVSIELSGTAKAESKMEVRRFLESFLEGKKRDFLNQGYYLRLQYGTLNVHEEENEDLGFEVMGSAMCVAK